MTTPDERARWIADCQGLVHSLAWQVARRLPVGINVDIEDLTGYGQVGLAQAATAFDPDRCVRFSTFAYYRIRGAIHDGLSNMVWYKQVSARGLKCDRMANETLSEALAFSSSEADEIGWFRELTGRLATVFLLGGTSGEENDQLEPIDDPASNPISAASRREIGSRLNELIDSLPEDGRTLIRAAYFENTSLKEAASRLGVSRSWASRLHGRTLKELEIGLRQSGVDGT